MSMNKGYKFKIQMKLKKKIEKLKLKEETRENLDMMEGDGSKRNFLR